MEMSQEERDKVMKGLMHKPTDQHSMTAATYTTLYYHVLHSSIVAIKKRLCLNRKRP